MCNRDDLNSKVAVDFIDINGVACVNPVAYLAMEDDEEARHSRPKYSRAKLPIPEDLAPYLDVWKRKYGELNQIRQLKSLKDIMIRRYAVEATLMDANIGQRADAAELLVWIAQKNEVAPEDIPASVDVYVKELVVCHYKTLQYIYELAEKNEEITRAVIFGLHRHLVTKQEIEKGETIIIEKGNPQSVAIEAGVFRQGDLLPYRPEFGVRSSDMDVVNELGVTAGCIEDAIDDFLTIVNQPPTTDDPELNAARAFHRFMRILPFASANLRVAQAIAMLVLVRNGRVPFLIGFSPDDRLMYFEAFRDADSQDAEWLAYLFRKWEMMALEEWFAEGARMTISRNKLGLELALAARKGKPTDNNQSLLLGENLFRLTKREFAKLQGYLERRTKRCGRKLNHKRESESSYSEKRTRNHFVKQVQELASHFEYFANTSHYHGWSSVILRTEEEKFLVVVSVHASGKKFTGEMAATAFCEWQLKNKIDPEASTVIHQEPRRVKRTEYGAPYKLCEAPFTFKYSSEKMNWQETLQEYLHWLRQVMRLALNRYIDGSPETEEDRWYYSQLKGFVESSDFLAMGNILRDWEKTYMEEQ